MSSVRIIFIAFVLLVALSLSASNSYAQQNISTIVCAISNTQTTVGNCMASALPLALMAIALSLVMVGIAYLVGDFLNYGQLKGFFRRELWETTKSMLIIVVVFSSLVVASSIATGLAGNTVSSGQAGTSLTSNLASLYTTVNQTYLYPQLQSSYTNFAGMLGLNIGVAALQSFTVSLWLPIPIPTPAGIIGAVQFGTSAALFQSNFITPANAEPSFLALINGQSIINTVTSIVVIPMMIVFQFQYDLLYVIAAIGLGVFLPVGIVMRAVPFLRGIGGTMIALGIGVAIIYPALLVGFNLPITNYIYSMTPPKAQQPQICPLPDYLLCNFWNAASSLWSYSLSSPPLSYSLAFGTKFVNGAQAGQAYSNGFYTGVSALVSNNLFTVINFVISDSLNSIVQLILFGFDIIIAYALISAIAGLLGGSISPFASRKLKLR